MYPPCPEWLLSSQCVFGLVSGRTPQCYRVATLIAIELPTVFWKAALIPAAGKVGRQKLTNTFHDNGEMRVLLHLLREQPEMLAQQFVSSKLVGVFGCAIVCDGPDSL